MNKVGIPGMRISISRYLYTRNQRDTFRRNDIAMAFCRVTTISRKDRSRFDRCKIDTRVEKKLFEHTTIKLNGLLHSSSTYVYTEAKTVSPIHLSIWRSSVSVYVVICYIFLGGISRNCIHYSLQG